MKKTSNEEVADADLRAEYDFSALRVVARGPGRKSPTEKSIQLEPDVAAMFPDSASVNEALRFLIRVTRSQARKS